jgi:hypothetical protein
MNACHRATSGITRHNGCGGWDRSIILEVHAMWQTTGSDGFDRALDDAQSQTHGLDPELGKNARQKLSNSLGVDDAQIVLSDLLAAGLDAVFGWLTNR